MYGVVLREFGPAGNLSYEEVDEPAPGKGEVRVAAEVSGVHQVETVVREGLAIGPPLPELPTVFGSEVAGVVDAVGEGVDPGWVGARVVTAMVRSGAYAEFVLADAAQLQVIPDGVSYETAVAMIRTGATTVGMLDIAGLTGEDTVLVTSAAGGIGRLLVQHAHRLGATVVGAAGGAAKVGAVRALGADIAVDYRKPGWDGEVRDALGGRRVTAALDGVGGDIADAAFGLIADHGRMVSIGASSRTYFAADPETLKERDITVLNALTTMVSDPSRWPDMERRALEAAAKGDFVPTVQAFRLADAAAAHTALARRETTGKVVLVP
ncbi:MAG TPA: zinc-binding dehydrogenase [Streptosporangiaceae bacterium]|jgi:NADPH2:quinone reductase